MELGRNYDPLCCVDVMYVDFHGYHCVDEMHVDLHHVHSFHDRYYDAVMMWFVPYVHS
jgi:hypothetical protein